MFIGFDDKEDMCKQCSVKDFNGLVIIAVYDIGDYEGYAEIIFFDDGKFYMVHGGHCSCYGLEEIWEPVEMPIEGIERIVTSSGTLSRYAEYIMKVVHAFERMQLADSSPEERAMIMKLLTAG